jgi:hypothetical protein
MVTPISSLRATASITSVQPSSQTTESATKKFAIPSLANLHNSTFAQGFSNNERQAAARALLRHDVHIDGTHYQARLPGGLHPSYFAFSSTAKRTSEKSLTHEELLEASLQDVFDAVSHSSQCPHLIYVSLVSQLSMQDRLDGGISVLIRCAGSEAVSSPENLPVDLYITPRELQETPERIGGDLAVWVQVFAQEFAMPHLERFNQRCVIENIQPPPCCK